MLARVRHLGCMNSLLTILADLSTCVRSCSCAASGPSAVGPSAVDPSAVTLSSRGSLTYKACAAGYREKNCGNSTISEAFSGTYGDYFFTFGSYLQYDRSK